MSKLRLSFPIVLLMACQISFAQPSMKDWLQVADAAYDTSDWYNAFRYYDAALKYKPNAADSLQILFKYAESARQFNAYLYARRAYRQVLESPLPKEYPLTLSSLRLAQMEQMLSIYDTAKIHYNYFIDEIASRGGPEAQYLEEARKGARDCDFALTELNRGFQLTIDSMPKGVNSIFSDYDATLLNDTLYYTSFQFTYRKDKNQLKRKRELNKMLTSVGGAPGVLLPDSINVDGMHTAHTAFNADGSRMYYTLCEYATLTDVRCDIYMRERDASGGWANPRKLSINVPGATNTQPHIGYAEWMDQELLFFTSDRTGGAGGLDIWCGNVNSDGDVVTAEPVAPANTPGNDVTPFFLDLTQTLYFSTDGRPSMGGYDVYETTLARNGWTAPRHVNYPVSTSYDDLYLSLKRDGTMGYLSSNRLGATLIDKDKEACCLDIFTFDMEVKLEVETFNEVDDSPLIGATVELYERTPAGDVRLGAPQTNAGGNTFNFPLLPGKSYLVKGTYPEFRAALDSSVVVNTIEFRDERIIKLPLYLGPPIDIVVNTYKVFDEAALNGATVELYEVTDAGEQLVAYRENDNGNNFTFQAQRNRKYQIKASRPYYFSKTDMIDLTQPEYQRVRTVERDMFFGQELEVAVVDSTSRELLSDVTLRRQLLTTGAPRELDRDTTADQAKTFLYEEKAFSMENDYRFVVSSPGYSSDLQDWAFATDQTMASEGRFVDTIPLPFRIDTIALYFDHDRPDPSNWRVTSTLSYDQTIADYKARKCEFIDQMFGTGACDNRIQLSRQDSLEKARYENFFDREVGQKGVLLARIAQKILDELEKGREVSLTIQGYCSPSGGKGYNENLSRRRIDSVKKFFLAYSNNGESIGTYYKTDNSGKFKVSEQPFGFNLVPPRIKRLLAGSRKDSIYNIAASEERKVVVKDIQFK